MAPGGTETQDEEASSKPPFRSKRLREKAELKDDSTSNDTDKSNKRARSEPDIANVDLRKKNEDVIKKIGIPGGENDPTRHRWKGEILCENLPIHQSTKS